MGALVGLHPRRKEVNPLGASPQVVGVRLVHQALLVAT
jgi:hypothetical protein